MRQLNFSDGFTSSVEPSQGVLQASSLRVFASDADFETDKGTAVAQGDIYSRSTDDIIRYYNGTSWVSLAEGDLAAHIADTSAAHAASAISFSPTGSIAATDAQSAIAEVATDAASALSSHESDTSSIHGIADTADLLTTSNSKSVTNKDFDGGTASNTNRITIPKAAKTTLDGLTRKQGTIVYDTTLNKPYYDDGSTLKVIGSGSGSGINFISDGDAEALNIFSQYNDSSTTRPVDGTGGTATNLSSAVSSTSPLAGTQSFILTKSGSASTQGMGWSVATATIDPAYRAKVLQIEFDYIVDSGTFVAGSSTAESDVIVYIYDVTNSTLIEPSSIKLLSNSTTISDKFVANFQTSATGSSYRLIFHCQSSSTANYSLKLDNIAVRPCNYVYGTPISDWVSYTPTLSNFGTTSNLVAAWRTVGSNEEYKIAFTVGTGAGSLGSISLRPGVSINTNLSSTGWRSAFYNTVGYGSSTSSSSSFSDVRVIANTSTSTTNVYLGAKSSTPSSNLDALNGSFFSSTSLDLVFSVPIAGKASSVQMSDGYDGREISAHLALASNYTPAANAVLKYDTVVYDKTNSYSISTGLYTVPSAGRYRIVVFGVTTSASGNLLVYKNGVANKYVATVVSASKGFAGGTTIEFNAGDTIGIHSDSNVLYSGDVRYNYVTIEKIQAPTTISATEVVAARATTTATTTIPTSEADFIPNTVEIDTHGGYNTSTGYVCQYPGIYRVKVQMVTGTFSTASMLVIRVRKNSTNVTTSTTIVPSGVSGNYTAVAIALVNCVAGDIIKGRYVTTAGTPALSGQAMENHIEIERIK